MQKFQIQFPDGLVLVFETQDAGVVEVSDSPCLGFVAREDGEGFGEAVGTNGERHSLLTFRDPDRPGRQSRIFARDPLKPHLGAAALARHLADR